MASNELITMQAAHSLAEMPHAAVTPDSKGHPGALQGSLQVWVQLCFGGRHKMLL